MFPRQDDVYGTFQDPVPVDPLPPSDAPLCCSALAACGPIVTGYNITHETQRSYSSPYRKKQSTATERRQHQVKSPI